MIWESFEYFYDVSSPYAYLAHAAVHFPRYPAAGFRGQSPNGLLGDWIQEVDWSVGQVLATLRAHAASAALPLDLAAGRTLSPTAEGYVPSAPAPRAAVA